MILVQMKIDGMHCPMCETHVNDLLRRVQGVKKVRSNHRKGTAEAVVSDETDPSLLAQSLESQGYRVESISTSPYVKRGLLSF